MHERNDLGALARATGAGKVPLRVAGQNRIIAQNGAPVIHRIVARLFLREPGKWVAFTGTGRVPIISYTPFYDGALALLARRSDPEDMVTIAHEAWPRIYWFKPVPLWAAVREIIEDGERAASPRAWHAAKYAAEGWGDVQ